MSKRLLLLSLVLACSVIVEGQDRFRLRFVATPAQGDTSNPLSAGRVPLGDTDLPSPGWVAAGVSGGVPSDAWTRCTTGTGTSVIAAYSGSSSTIETALSGCDANHYVELGSGTFTLSSPLDHTYDNRELRGQGMDTILNITSDASSSWAWGGGCTVTLTGNGYVSDAAPTLGSGSNIVTWSGTNGAAGVYTQGATLIDLSSAASYAVGDMIALYQDEEADGDLPTTGFFTSDKRNGTGNGSISWVSAGAGDHADFDALPVQRSMITAKNGNQVTISPGLIFATGLFQTGLSPKAARTPAANLVTNAGYRNLRITIGAVGVHLCDIGVGYGNNVWLKGVGLTPIAGAVANNPNVSSNFPIEVVDSVGVEIRDGFMNRVLGGGTSTETSYGVACYGVTLLKVENMIFNDVESPLMPLTGCLASVWSHNFDNHISSNEGGLQFHAPGAHYTLAEGNRLRKVWGDLFHGNTMLNVIFRNYLAGWGVGLDAHHRGFSVIGNAINATTVHHNCVSDSTDYTRSASFGVRLGYASTGASSAADDGVSPDTETCDSTMDWGNYTTVGGSVFNSAHVPTTWTVPNTVPASNDLPSSLILASIPCWFTYNGSTQPFPLHGPDVTGGAYLSGHANKTPAQVAFEASGGTLGSYSASTIASFNPALYCQ